MKTNSDEMHNQEMLLKKIRQSSEVFDKLANSYEVWVPESGLLAGRRNRDKNVEEISAMVGFANRQSFYAAFYKNVGETPNGYRKRNQEKK